MRLLAHHRQEVAKGLAFVGPVVRPQRREVVGGVEHAEEVFQPPLAAVGRPQRVALEVEEQIALVRLGQHHQRLRVGDLVGRLAVDARRDLQARLRGQRCDGARGQFGHAALVVRELTDGGDARVDKAGPLTDPHAGHQQQVVVRADLEGALGTPEARPDLVVLPRHRLAGGQVPVEQAFQCGAAGRVHRKQFVDAVADVGAVAEHEFHVRRHRHAGAGQRVGVRSELKERLDLDRAGELGVAEPIVRPVKHQEIGEADEPAVEHRGLIDDRRPALDSAHGGLRGRRQPVDGEGGPTDDRDVLFGESAKLVEVALFVFTTELGGPGEQFVFDRDRGTPAELGVERPEQGVLATGSRGEVRCAVDDSVAGSFRCDEHGATVGAKPDTSRRCQPVLPMSSTPLPFQRNFTTLSSPGTLLEYRSATVSPVEVEFSMPLKP